MEHAVTVPEMLGLLAFFWAPAMIPAALVQWLMIRPAAWGTLAGVLLGALLLEVLLALAIWLSPVHRLFPHLENLGVFSFGGVPLQAAVVAATAISAIVWFARRRLRTIGVAA